MGPSHPPRLLTIAGSDSGGGAGIQADLKTFGAHGAYGMSAVTAITAQNTVAVTAIHDVPPAVVAAQIDAVFDDLGVDGVKIGMLSQAPLVLAVAERLAHHLEARAIPVVLDPVMVAKSGDMLLADSAVDALLQELLPLATVVTPNLPEAHRLTGLEGDDEATHRRMAEELAQGGGAVLIKGGHGRGETLVDLLFDGKDFHRFSGPRLETRSDHGTGCTLSSAITARLAAGDPLPVAVEGAIKYLRQAIVKAFPLGAGRGPVHHFH